MLSKIKSLSFSGKKNGSLLLLFSLFFNLLSSNAQITFQKVISVPQGSAANAVEQTTDGGYIMTGAAVDPSQTFFDVYLVKTDNEGDTLWTKTYTGTDDNEGFSVQQTSDGGYIVAGMIVDIIQYIFVIKTDALGDTLWTRTYGGFNPGLAYCIQQTNDSGYILSGYTDGYGAGGYDVYLIKINSVGAITWTKTYGGSANDIARCVQQTSDSGYIVCGHTGSFGAGVNNVYLIKTDVNGDTLWTKTYGGIDDDEAFAVQQTKDDGYIVTGYTTSFGAGNKNVYLIKTNAGGDTLWTKTYGGSDDDWGNDVHQTNDGGYIIAGFTDSFGAGDGDVYLIKTNANGDTIWTKTYGGTNEDLAYSVRQTSDSGYIIAGFTTSFILPQNNDGLYLIKTDANGNSSGCYQGTTATIVGSSATQVGGTQAIVSSGGSASQVNTVIGSAGNDSTLCFSSVIMPVGNFLASDTELCANSCINFTNSSSNATSWQWHFDGATDSISTEQNPQNICYATSGIYSVMLIASNSAGSDSVTFSNYIYVIHSPPPPVITQNLDTLHCSTDTLYTSYQWYLDSAAIGGATDTFLVITHGGNYNVQVTNKNNCKAGAGINLALGIQSYSNNNIVYIYPNPVSDKFTVYGLQFTVGRVEIYNVLGQEVLNSREFGVGTGDGSHSPYSKLPAVIDVSSLPAGIYFLQIVNKSGICVSKFVKE